MVAEQLKLLISSQKCSKTDLSRYLAVARTTLDSWLSGKTEIPSDKLILIARYFKVPVSFLFGESSQKIDEKSLRSLLIDQLNQLQIINKKLDDIANSLQIKK